MCVVFFFFPFLKGFIVNLLSDPHSRAEGGGIAPMSLMSTAVKQQHEEDPLHLRHVSRKDAFSRMAS